MPVTFELAEEEPEMPSDRDEILELLQRRDAIQGWLDRLEDQRGTVNAQVIERVRADYLNRLREALDALATYRDALAAELADAEARLAAAEHARADAGDRLDETGLRHRIGELSDEEWAERREELETIAEDALKVERESASDVGRLRDLLDQLDERESEEGSSIDAILLSDAAEDDAGDDAPSAPVPPPPADEAQAFLADIDRALAEELDADPDLAPGEEPLSDDEPDTSPKPGLKCPECGYTNDISAWFCGVCGADIG